MSLAGDHGQHEINAGKRARTMSDDHNDPAALAHARDRLGQRPVAVGIEVRVRFVENDQERIAVHGARERNTLALAGG